MISLLTLLDDIATTFDDVAVMTKIAIKKTSVIMSDDLAVNAAVVTGTPADRELPIVKAIFLGSLLNKVYCIVGILALIALYEPVLKVILFLGGLLLAFEGAHKDYEKIFHKNDEHKEVRIVSDKEKIKGAVRTDLVLSIEIILIAKQSISGSFFQQVLSLVLVGFAASVLIYGLVAILVKVDDFGVYLVNKNFKKMGLSLVSVMPYAMKGLGILGTIAMFLVGGGIVMHTLDLPYWLPEILHNLVIGVISGILVMIPFELYQRKKRINSQG